MANSEVEATCSVRSLFDVKVTWLLDEKSPSSQANQVTYTTHIISTLRVASQKWKQLKHVKCKAEHICFSPTEETKLVSGKTKRQKAQKCHQN